MADDSYDPATGGSLRPGHPIVRLDPHRVDLVRLLTLNEVMGPGGPLEVLLDNTPYDAPSSEQPQEGSTELWEIVDLTADAHPVHLHLTQFQVADRQAFDVRGYSAVYAAAFSGGRYAVEVGPPLPYAASPASGGKLGGNLDVTPFLRSAATPPPAYEAGWKDTVIAYPGQVTRIVVRWAPTDTPLDVPGTYPFDPSGPGDIDRGYVWHCHIIDHEDNEMMRPMRVTPVQGAVRTVTAS